MDSKTVRRSYDLLPVQVETIESYAASLPGFNKSQVAQIVIGLGLAEFERMKMSDIMAGGAVRLVTEYLLKSKAGSRSKLRSKRRLHGKAD